ncbi:MAG TPA: TldD/PmbA family protein [Terriglobales bacterium]|jgi:PmbA protein|nr:TldD/PmbA family protein [Terriglobales bacterium]
MLTKEQSHDIFERIKKFSTADEIEVYISGGRSALTRFANNFIHQNVADENHAVSIRTAFDGRTARATTNKLDEDSLRRVVQSAESLSKVQHPNPDLLPMTEGNEPLTLIPSRWFEETRTVGPQERAAGVNEIVKVAKREKLVTAGIFSVSEYVEGLFNSRGLARFHQQTSSEISITMLGDDSSGWQKANSPDVRNLNPVALAEVAARKARQSTAPRELAPGKYTVILEPAAVLDLVGFMFYDFAGLALLDQRSFLNNRMGSNLFGENITIHDNVSHPLQSGSPFDGEGAPRQHVTLVEKGAIKNLVYARATVEKMKKSELAGKVGDVRPTGHGFLLPNEVGEAPLNVVFAPPETRNAKTVDEMVASTERGVWVTRLWYIREVEPYEKILTGMTRDGTFYVENGKLQYGIRNFRFNQSLVELLSKVDALSIPVRASGEESFDMVVPAMKVRDFNFTEVTKF